MTKPGCLASFFYEKKQKTLHNMYIVAQHRAAAYFRFLGAFFPPLSPELGTSGIFIFFQ